MNLVYRMDGRVEWKCEHGVGHTVYYPEGSDDTHGCDGCCGKSDEFTMIKNLVLHVLRGGRQNINPRKLIEALQ